LVSIVQQIGQHLLISSAVSLGRRQNLGRVDMDRLFLRRDDRPHAARDLARQDLQIRGLNSEPKQPGLDPGLGQQVLGQ